MNREGGNKYENYWGNIIVNYLDNKIINYFVYINNNEKKEFVDYTYVNNNNIKNNEIKTENNINIKKEEKPHMKLQIKYEAKSEEKHNKEKELKLGRKDKNMKEIIKIQNVMEREFFIMKMEIDMKATLKMIKDMEAE